MSCSTVSDNLVGKEHTKYLFQLVSYNIQELLDFQMSTDLLSVVLFPPILNWTERPHKCKISVTSKFCNHKIKNNVPPDGYGPAPKW